MSKTGPEVLTDPAGLVSERSETCASEVIEMTDGVLTVRLPKAAQARSRRIEIRG